MVAKSKELTTPIKSQHAKINIPERQEEQTFEAPDEIKALGEGEEALSSLTPVVEFEKIGDYVLGTYLGNRAGIGPNKSRLYDLKLTEDQLKRIGADTLNIPIKNGMVVSVWGSTILDSMMDRLHPPMGSILFVQYTGDVQTERKQNPAHTYKVTVYPAKK